MQSDIFHKRIVLAVDDEPAIRSLLKSALPSGGFEAIVASGGLEAIECFRHRYEDIGVVLLDVCMPGLNGIETGRVLRELDPQIAICFMTGYHLEEIKAQLSEFHAPLLQKPFNPSALFAVLTKLINSQKLVSPH